MPTFSRCASQPAWEDDSSRYHILEEAGPVAVTGRSIVPLDLGALTVTIRAAMIGPVEELFRMIPRWFWLICRAALLAPMPERSATPERVSVEKIWDGGA